MSTRSKTNVLNLRVQSPSLLALSEKNGTGDKFKDLMVFFENKLADIENRVMNRLGELMAEVNNLRSDMKASNKRINVLETKLTAAHDNISDLQVRLDKLENASVSSDVVVHNIPVDVDVGVVVKSTFEKLGCSSLPYRAFRIKARTNKNAISAPVIIKLSSADDRVELFKSIALYRRKYKHNPSLCDIGLSGDGYISIFECLTPINKIIMRSALNLKAKNEISSVFSLRGQVFVRVRAKNEPVKINNIVDLKTMVGAKDK